MTLEGSVGKGGDRELLADPLRLSPAPTDKHDGNTFLTLVGIL